VGSQSLKNILLVLLQSNIQFALSYHEATSWNRFQRFPSHGQQPDIMPILVAVILARVARVPLDQLATAVPQVDQLLVEVAVAITVELVYRSCLGIA
jgi:hypothetical protein